MGDWVIEANNLTKVYQMGEVEVHALRGIDLLLVVWTDQPRGSTSWMESVFQI